MRQAERRINSLSKGRYREMVLAVPWEVLERGLWRKGRRNRGDAVLSVWRGVEEQESSDKREEAKACIIQVGHHQVIRSANTLISILPISR